MCIEQIRIRFEQLSCIQNLNNNFEWLEPKQKKFEGPLQIKETV